MLPGLRPPTLTPERGNPPPRAADGFQIAGGMRGEPAGSFSPLPGPFPPPDGVNRDGTARGALRVRPPETCRLSCAHPRRSGRVAEGGALEGADSSAPTKRTRALRRASVRRRRVGYPARTRGEVAEWLKAAPSKAPTRRRRPERTRALRRASVRRRRVGYPARTRGEVAEWLKAAPSKAPTRRRRP